MNTVYTHFPGRGHSNPLQCSCLKNPMDRGAGAVHGVARSLTRLKQLSTHACTRVSSSTVLLQKSCVEGLSLGFHNMKN